MTEPKAISNAMLPRSGMKAEDHQGKIPRWLNVRRCSNRVDHDEHSLGERHPLRGESFMVQRFRRHRFFNRDRRCRVWKLHYHE
jgi:hypothetical protein